MKQNFAIIGAARSGTTALAELLGQHPEIFISDPKEPHFFAHVGTDYRYSGSGDEVMMNSRIVREPEKYMELFNTAFETKYRGDGSVSTLCFPERAIQNIKDYADPDIKLIVMLREPVARCYSSYMYLRARGHEKVTDFEEALRIESQRKRENYHHMWLYKELSHYEKQLRPFYESFGDNLYVVILEEFKLDWESEVYKIAEFLEVESSYKFTSINEVNRGGLPKSQFLMICANILRKNVLIEKIAKKVIPKSFRNKIKNSNLTMPELPSDLKNELQAEFRSDVDYIESLLGRGIDSWR